MELALCMHVHQPFRLRRFSIFHDINRPPEEAYFDHQKNQEIFERASNKCYVPATKIITEHANQGYKFCFSITGTWVESAMRWRPDVLELFQDLVKTGNVELLAETYYHSLASLYSYKGEFEEQVKMHKKMLKDVFGYTPRVFRNYELVYSNDIGERIERMGFSGVITEGTERILGWRSPTYVYKRPGGKLKILLRHYRLSDDVGFRFSARDWVGWPLTADKYADWISQLQGQYVLLYVDYETFGEHQWPETGILEFLEHLPGELEKRGVEMVTPSDIVERHESVDDLDVPSPISWADESRDVSTWLGNPLQWEAFKKLQSFNIKNGRLKRIWRLLQTSDHLYYLSMKTTKDGVIHQYFSPYDSPYDAFINFMNILEDLERRVREVENK